MPATSMTKANGWTRPESGRYVHTATGIEVARCDFGTASGGAQSFWVVRTPDASSRSGYRRSRSYAYRADAEAQAIRQITDTI